MILLGSQRPKAGRTVVEFSPRDASLCLLFGHDQE